jgi:hypothetical protein
MVYLRIQRGRRKRYGILIIIDGIDEAALCFLRMVRADADALAAVDALVRCDDGLAVTHADGLRGAVLYAVGTAFTLILK